MNRTEISETRFNPELARGFDEVVAQVLNRLIPQRHRSSNANRWH